jgi:hypothetical protein
VTLKHFDWQIVSERIKVVLNGAPNDPAETAIIQPNLPQLFA